MADADARTASDLVSDQPTPVQAALFSLTTDLAQMKAERADAIANWKQTSLALRENESRSEEVDFNKNLEKDTSEAVALALAEGNYMYRQDDKMPAEWNEGVVKRIETVKGIIRTAKPAELVKWVVEGQTARELRDMLAKEHKRANDLAAELEARSSMRPSLGGGDGRRPPAGPEAPRARDPEKFAESLFSR
jgi:hypothetical protein